MGQTSSPVPEQAVDQGPIRPAPKNGPFQIRTALEDILLSAPFKNSQQAQKLLRYIVEHSVTHEDPLLRERVIGSAVFGRRPDYDTGIDPVVRIRASEVRKRLAQYYQSYAHADHELTIEIPSGSYRAAFRWRETHLEGRPAGGGDGSEPEPPGADLHPATEAGRTAFAEEVHSTESPPSRTQFPHQRRYLQAVLALGIVIVCLLSLDLASRSVPWRPKAPSAAWAEFWSPWLTSPKPVLIAIGSNAVYRFSDSLTDPYQQSHHLEPQGDEFFLPLSPDATIRGRDIQPAENSFVALGDVAAASAMVATLSAQHHPYQERFPNDISFAELRNSPSVLVGGFNNPMTVELTKRLPFVLRKRNEIDDTVHGRRWVLNASKDSHDTEDYAIVTRLVQSGGDAPVLCIAGIGQYGTLAAADFVVSPASVSGLAHRLPAHWADHNLQVILHLKVIDFKASAVEIVAAQTW